ncbi:MAG: transcription antitermination factor NusB, partial [Corynebacterium kroppenstedtii]|nr:transcription antitermination factor NusB [Corynebacterium kroppenstedtii]
MSGGFRSRSESARHLKSDVKGAKQTPSDRGASHSDRKTPQQRQHRQRNDNTKRHQGQRGSSGGNKTNRKPAREHHRDVPRYVAWQALFRVDTENAFGNIVLPSLMKEYGLTGRDAAFTTELGYGSLRAQGLVDAVIGECSSRPLEAIDPAVIAVLRLGTYQLLRMRVGNHAAVNTSVDLCQEVEKPKAKGFVNAVLHSVAQRTESEWIDHLTKNADPF